MYTFNLNVGLDYLSIFASRFERSGTACISSVYVGRLGYLHCESLIFVLYTGSLSLDETDLVTTFTSSEADVMW